MNIINKSNPQTPASALHIRSMLTALCCMKQISYDSPAHAITIHCKHTCIHIVQCAQNPLCIQYLRNTSLHYLSKYENPQNNDIEQDSSPSLKILVVRFYSNLSMSSFLCWRSQMGSPFLQSIWRKQPSHTLNMYMYSKISENVGCWNTLYFPSHVQYK